MSNFDLATISISIMIDGYAHTQLEPARKNKTILVLACNVLMSEMTGVFKISNHGQER